MSRLAAALLALALSACADKSPPPYACQDIAEYGCADQPPPKETPR